MGHIPCIPIACSEMSGSHSEMMTPSDMHGWDLWAGFRIQFKWKYKTLRLHQCLTLNICCDVMEVFLVFGCLVKQGTGEGARRGTQANKNPLNYQELKQRLLTILKIIILPLTRLVYPVVTQWKAQQWQQSSKVPGCTKARFAQIQKPHAQKQRKEAAYLQKASRTQGSPARYPHLHYQLLNEVWKEVDPGFIPSTHSATSHAPELPWVGPAFPPGAQSQVQAVTQHFCYTL